MRKGIFEILEIKGSDVVISAQDEPEVRYLVGCRKRVVVGEKWQGSLNLAATEMHTYVFVPKAKVLD